MVAVSDGGSGVNPAVSADEPVGLLERGAIGRI